jgi:hypothetical protein
MARKPKLDWLSDEVADFLASLPSREEVLAYRPSPQAQKRLKMLLGKSKQGRLAADEEWELQQFEYVETLLQAVKARLRPARAVPS